MFERWLRFALIPLFLSPFFTFAEVRAGEQFLVAGDQRELVPRYEHALLHAPEVQAELRLTADQVKGLEAFFGELDGDWFRARNQPMETQTQSLDGVDKRRQAWLPQHLQENQRKRLQQLELQAQSVRCLLRTDVVKELGLIPAQIAKLSELAKQTNAAAKELAQAQAKGGGYDAMQRRALAAKTLEEKSIKEILNPAQQQKISLLLGEPFDTTKLKRIYPMVPEFVEVEQWINSPPLKLAELRGKVVIVHFYAFQCHNCHANFAIYRRWHEKWKSKGVEIIGIQTPETKEERKPDSIIAAAKEKELEFPILLDLESKNWQAWGNTMWPTVYVVDKNGYLRHWWQGELQWQGATADKTIEEVVEQLLLESSNP